MEKHLMEKFAKILEEEETIRDVKVYYNICGDWCVSYWIDDTQYYLSIDEIFRK